MKLFIPGILIVASLAAWSNPALGAGFSQTAIGTQYVDLPAGQTTIISPQFLCPGTGLLTQSGVTTNTVFGVTEAVTNGVIATLSYTNNNATGGTFFVSSNALAGTNYTLFLTGAPPLDDNGSPIATNQYQYDGTTTYFALVTAGPLKGNFFTVLSNTASSLVIDPKGLSVTPHSILAVTVQSYWTLASLFPSGMSNVSFVATTNLSNIMSQVVISPLQAVDGQAPQSAGTIYYFSAALTNWVSVTNPTVPAGNAIVPPGAYVYFENTNAGSVPLREFISGKILTSQLNLYFATSSSNNLVTYFGLPRNSPYRLSALGFDNRNFTSSLTKNLLGRKDMILQDNGHGEVGFTYFKYRGQWYDAADTSAPVDPILAAGTVFGVLKVASQDGSQLFANTSNVRLSGGLLPSVILKQLPMPVSGLGSPANPTNTGGD